MRTLASKEKIDKFMHELGKRARKECSVYFTGGTTAVLTGWRDATIDIDLRFEPELDEIFRALPEIKEKLDLNIELVAPSDFIPELPGWRDRCGYIRRESKVSFFHYDLYSQALAKIERGHEQDFRDVESMLRTGSVDRKRLLDLFWQIEPYLYKYPAIDRKNFAEAVRQAVHRPG
jgi:hypothetical protein